MARNWYGSHKVTREDMYTSKVKYTDSDIRKEKFKMVLWVLVGYLFFHFIVMGWSI
jgi:Trk-type K+ transport system membrane component